MTAEYIIAQLNLRQHPEGGFYRETYRSAESLEVSGYKGRRNVSTAIYYLVPQGVISAFHRIKQDEMWHFYVGASLELHIISKTGKYHQVLLGNALDKGEVPQYLVSGGDYFAARVAGQGNYSLMGCTVAPGFDFIDFEMPSRQELLTTFPEHTEIIRTLSHP